MKYDLVSVGSVTKDIFLITDRGKIFKTPKDKLAPIWLGFELGEKIFIEEALENMGGVAAGLAIGTTRLGLKSAPFGMVGKDNHGEWIRDEMKKNKVDTKFIKTDAKKKSAVSTIIVDKKTGERIIFLEKSSGKIDISSLKNIETQWLSISSLTGNLTKETEEITGYIRKYRTKLILAPSTSMIREGAKKLNKLLFHAEIVFLNKNEAAEIAFCEKKNISDAKGLIGFLHGLGPKMVCLTDGEKGAYVGDGAKIYYSPIKKVKAVDVTGAGDAFMSGFLGKYLKNKNIKESLEAGIRNSASVVKYFGTTRGLLRKNEIFRIKL